METRRFFNPSLPQTLQIAVWLLYFNAFWGILYLLGGAVLLALVGIASGIGAFGIANEKRWGYGLAVGAAIASVALLVLASGGLTGLFRIGNLIPFLFDVALLAALLHPQSRDYQRIWFS